MFTAREILAVSCLGYHTKTGKHCEGGGGGTEELGPSIRSPKVSGQFREEGKSKNDGRDKEGEDNERYAAMNPGGVGIRRDRTRFTSYEMRQLSGISVR